MIMFLFVCTKNGKYVIYAFAYVEFVFVLYFSMNCILMYLLPQCTIFNQISMNLHSSNDTSCKALFAKSFTSHSSLEYTYTLQYFLIVHCMFIFVFKILFWKGYITARIFLDSIALRVT